MKQVMVIVLAVEVVGAKRDCAAHSPLVTLAQTEVSSLAQRAAPADANSHCRRSRIGARIFVLGRQRRYEITPGS
jgi:hypothetical protein